jgi:hypothetical protein
MQQSRVKLDFEELARLFSIRASLQPFDNYVRNWVEGRALEVKIGLNLNNKRNPQGCLDENLNDLFVDAREKIKEELIRKSGLDSKVYFDISKKQIRILNLFYSYLFFMTFLALREDRISSIRSSLGIRASKKQLRESFCIYREVCLLVLLDEINSWLQTAAKYQNSQTDFSHIVPTFPATETDPVIMFIKIFINEAEFSNSLPAAKLSSENVLRNMFPRNIDDPSGDVSEVDIFNVKALVLQRKSVAIQKLKAYKCDRIGATQTSLIMCTNNFFMLNNHKSCESSLISLTSVGKEPGVESKFSIKKKPGMLALDQRKIQKVEIKFKKISDYTYRICKKFSGESVFKLELKFKAID